MERAALSIRARARESSGALRGRVRIALVEELASYWLAPRLPAFRAAYPTIDLQLLAGVAPLDLARGEAELAVRTPRPRQPGLAASRLGRTSFALYASKELLGGRRVRVDASTKRPLPLLVYTYTHEHHVLQVASWFQPVLAAADVVMTTNSSHALVGAAKASAGFAVLPHLMARAHPDLVCVSADVADMDVWLVTHPEFRRDATVRLVADFLKRAATGADGLC